MTIRIASALLLLTFIQCKTDNISIKVEEQPVTNSKNTLTTVTFFDTLPFKSIHRKYESPLCFNMTMDSIFNNKLHAFTLTDLRSNEIILHSDPMNNGYDINKTNDSTYIISMKTSLPKKGNWDTKGFNQYIIATYQIIINETEYSIALIDHMNEIPFNRNQFVYTLQQFKNHSNNPSSTGLPSSKIELLEYLLFVDLLSGNKEYENTYFDILDKHAFGGQFREYMIGNTMALYSLGKITSNPEVKERIESILQYNLSTTCD